MLHVSCCTFVLLLKSEVTAFASDTVERINAGIRGTSVGVQHQQVLNVGA